MASHSAADGSAPQRRAISGMTRRSLPRGEFHYTAEIRPSTSAAAAVDNVQQRRTAEKAREIIFNEAVEDSSAFGTKRTERVD